MNVADGESTRVPAQRLPYAEERVYIVDADVSCANAIRSSLVAEGINARVIRSPHALARAIRRDAPSAGCVLADSSSPMTQAVDLPTALARHGVALPVVLLSEHGGVGMVREAFQRGAVDFLQKPVEKLDLLRTVHCALERDRQQREMRASVERFGKRLSRLSMREQQVMAMACEGYQNREIAALIGISPRTVEVHKAHLMEKLKVRTLAELMRVRQIAGAMPGGNRLPPSSEAAD